MYQTYNSIIQNSNLIYIELIICSIKFIKSTLFTPYIIYGKEENCS